MATDFLDSQTTLSLRLMSDTAALVLIWLVQLVIYPAFLHLREGDFKRWHVTYTQRVTYVVLPVMLGQLVLYGSLVFTTHHWDVWLNLALVLTAWAITFFRAVPLHGSLDVEDDHLTLSAKLVSINWWRTALWSLVWGVSVWIFLST
jgi:hypothetical protein